MSTERYKPPAWALSAAREAMEFAGIAFLSDAAVESVAGRMVEQRSIGDRAGWNRRGEADALKTCDGCCNPSRWGAAIERGFLNNDGWWHPSETPNWHRCSAPRWPYSGPTGDDGGGR